MNRLEVVKSSNGAVRAVGYVASALQTMWLKIPQEHRLEIVAGMWRAVTGVILHAFDWLVAKFKELLRIEEPAAVPA